MISNKDIYRCYSNYLKDYMATNGIKYFLVARDIVTNQKFYAFEKTDNFRNVLNQWEQTNPKK